MERNAEANLDLLLGDPSSEKAVNLRKKMFYNPRFEHIARTLIPLLDRRGFLESSMKKGDLPEWFKKEVHDLQVMRWEII